MGPALMTMNNMEFYKGWISGFWDGEGSVSFYKTKQSPNSYNRALSVLNSEKNLIDKASQVLSTLGIKSRLYVLTNRKGSLGNKTLWVLKISDAHSIRKFAEQIGFQSKEKQDKLQKLLDSYVRYCDKCGIRIGWHKRGRKYCDDCLSPDALWMRKNREKATKH